jgi:signal transduction histidine kinase
MAAKLREFRRIDHERLVRTQQTTQLAIDSLPDAVFIIGPDSSVEISNRSASELFGIQPGMKVRDLEKLHWLAPLYESAKDGQHPDAPQGYQSAVQVLDHGRERFLLPRAVPMIGADNKPIGVTLILVDVTRLRGADEAKSNVVSTVSHELRTPLTSVRMALDLLSQGKFAIAMPEQSALLTAAREDAERLHHIIENLMNISRLESGHAAFDMHPMRPSEIIAQAVEPLRAEFAGKQIALTIEDSQNLPEVSADPASIGSALANLLSNALKYTPAGGKVSVAASQEGDFIAFTVTDTGPGIPGEYATRIFDKFFRIPQNQGPIGAGLGLAIAKDVIDAHGGTIKLCPAASPGSKFQFTLRKAASSAPTALNTSTRQA